MKLTDSKRSHQREKLFFKNVEWKNVPHSNQGAWNLISETTWNKLICIGNRLKQSQVFWGKLQGLNHRQRQRRVLWSESAANYCKFVLTLNHQWNTIYFKRFHSIKPSLLTETTIFPMALAFFHSCRYNFYSFALYLAVWSGLRSEVVLIRHLCTRTYKRAVFVCEINQLQVRQMLVQAPIWPPFVLHSS